MTDHGPATRDQAAVHVEGLMHRYPPARQRRRERDAPQAPEPPAVNDLSFSVQPGEVFGVLGPNGSGKSTLFAILATMLRPTAGRAEIFGHGVVDQPDAVRRQLGVVFQAPSLDDQLTAAENLMVHGRLYGVAAADLRQRRDGWLEYFALADRSGHRVARFSGGMRRRLEIARALISSPRLLLMDEPTSGLDPVARRELWDLLARLREETGMTLLLTTHLMDEAERCDRLAILDRGRLVALDSPAALRQVVGGMVLTLTLAADASPEDARQLAEQLARRCPEAATPPSAQGRVVRLEDPHAAPLAHEIARELGDRLQSLTIGQPTLDDVFVHLTGRHLQRDA